MTLTIAITILSLFGLQVLAIVAALTLVQWQERRRLRREWQLMELRSQRAAERIMGDLIEAAPRDTDPEMRREESN